MESNFPGWERILSRYNVRVVPSSEQGPTPPSTPFFSVYWPPWRQEGLGKSIPHLRPLL